MLCQSLPYRALLSAALLTFAGCTAFAPAVLSPTVPPIVETRDVVREVAVPAPAKPSRQREDSVAILLSRDLPMYTNVAAELDRRLRVRHRTYSLEHATPDALKRRIQANGESTVVAIGPAALQAAQSIAGVDVIYAQVTRPSILATQLFRGVDAIPPFAPLLAEWRRASPGVATVGVVASAHMRSHVSRLQHAAASVGITLIAQEAGSDKEALLRFRRMLPLIDGYVLLPDETVLSPTVLRQILAHSEHQKKQVVVYSEALFALGAFMLVTARPDDIANQVLALLADPSRHNSELRQLTTMTSVLRTASR